MPKSSRKQTDEAEKKLLKILQKNSGDSIENIAKKCGFSKQKVWRIKKKLEKNNAIWGYPAVVDDVQFGLKKYLILLKRTHMPVTPEKMEIPIKGRLKEELEKIGISIDFSFLIMGDYDMAICISAPSSKELMILSNKLSSLFGDNIADVKIFDVIFPLQICGIDNPNIDQLKEFF